MLTNGLTRYYELEREIQFNVGQEKIGLSKADIAFEGADLKGGRFFFQKNKLNWEEISYKEGRLETSDGTFVSEGILKQGKSKIDVTIKLFLDPIKEGFKAEVKELYLSGKKVKGRFPVKEMKFILKRGKPDPS